MRASEWLVFTLQQQLQQVKSLGLTPPADEVSEPAWRATSSIGLEMVETRDQLPDEGPLDEGYAMDKTEYFDISSEAADSSSHGEVHASQHEDEVLCSTAQTDDRGRVCAADTGGCAGCVVAHEATETAQMVLPGARIRLTEDVEACFSTYFADAGWQGSVLEVAHHDWDSRWFDPDTDYILVKFESPPNTPRPGCWWETLRGESYFKAGGVKLVVRAREVEVVSPARSPTAECAKT